MQQRQIEEMRQRRIEQILAYQRPDFLATPLHKLQLLIEQIDLLLERQHNDRLAQKRGRIQRFFHNHTILRNHSKKSGMDIAKQFASAISQSLSQWWGSLLPQSHKIGKQLLEPQEESYPLHTKHIYNPSSAKDTLPLAKGQIMRSKKID